RVGLGRGEELECALPLVPVRADPLRVPAGRVEHENAAAPAFHLNLENRAGDSNRGVERRVRRRADDGFRISVEPPGPLAARGVLELLHHERAAPRGRGPVDTSQRLALLVVADAVELEADGTPKEEPPAVLGACAAVEEDSVELDEARIDDERLLLLEREARLGEAKRIRDREPNRREGVPASRHVA